MIFVHRIRIEFNHCDPAGIVFYPRFLEMASSVCENFFREGMGVSTPDMIASGHGTPTVRLAVDFLRPSRLGDLLEWRLSVERVGRTSLPMRLECWHDGEHRLTVHTTVVWMALTGQTVPWPDAVRARLSEYVEV